MAFDPSKFHTKSNKTDINIMCSEALKCTLVSLDSKFETNEYLDKPIKALKEYLIGNLHKSPKDAYELIMEHIRKLNSTVYLNPKGITIRCNFRDRDIFKLMIKEFEAKLLKKLSK